MTTKKILKPEGDDILGWSVRDEVSGCEGIVTGRTSWLNGCIRVGIQQKMKEDGSVPDPYWTDDNQIRVIGLKKFPRRKPREGPMNDPKRPVNDPLA